MKRFNSLTKIGLILILSVLLSSIFGACEPGITIRVRNYTSETLQIYYGETYIDDAVPKGEVKFKTLYQYPEPAYPIIAKDERGNIIYSKVFSRTELKENRYRVVIPSIVQSTEQSDNVTVSDNSTRE